MDEAGNENSQEDSTEFYSYSRTNLNFGCWPIYITRCTFRITTPVDMGDMEFRKGNIAYLKLDDTSKKAATFVSETWCGKFDFFATAIKDGDFQTHNKNLA